MFTMRYRQKTNVKNAFKWLIFLPNFKIHCMCTVLHTCNPNGVYSRVYGARWSFWYIVLSRLYLNKKLKLNQSATQTAHGKKRQKIVVGLTSRLSFTSWTSSAVTVTEVSRHETLVEQAVVLLPYYVHRHISWVRDDVVRHSRVTS